MGAVSGADELTDDEILERLGLAGDGLGAGGIATGVDGPDGSGMPGEGGEGSLGDLLLSPSGKKGGGSGEGASIESILEASGGVMPVRRSYSAVRLDNNGLRSLAGLVEALAIVCSDVAEIRWLDLSHNSIDSEGLRAAGLDALPALRTLHLHGNRIHGHRAVRAAFGSLVEGGCRRSAHGPMTPAHGHLLALSLHANPIKEAPAYREWVLGSFPGLDRLDNVPVTRRERDYASAWLEIHGRGGPGAVPAHVMATFGLDVEGKELAKARRRKPLGLAGEAVDDEEDGRAWAEGT